MNYSKMASSVLAEISSCMETAQQNGFRKDLVTTVSKANGFRRDLFHRPSSDQLAFIESHNKQAINSKRLGYISDGGELSDSDEEGYKRQVDDSSSESSDSSSDENVFRRSKTMYEHYDPDKFEQGEEMNGENDDCSFGKSKKRDEMKDILHHGVGPKPNVIDGFGGWENSFSIRTSKPSKSNIRKYTKPQRTCSAFPRLGSYSNDATFKFKHYDDISQYIKQYREDISVKDNQMTPPKEGECVLVPDPYATKLKNNMCSIAENCDFLTVYSSAGKEKEKSKEKDRSQSTYLRPRPSSLVYYPTHDSSDDSDCPVSVTSYQRPRSSLSYKDRTRTDPSLSHKEKTMNCEFSFSRQSSRQQPRPFSDQPFVVRTLSVKDRSRTLNLAPVRNQDNNDKVVHPIPHNMSLTQYLNLVVPHRQLRSSNSNMTSQSCSTQQSEENDGKPPLHKKNLQLNIDGPCDPWTPKFEFKRSSSRGTINVPKQTNNTRKRLTPDSSNSKPWQTKQEFAYSRANTYHSHICNKSDVIDNELTVNASSNRNNSNVQRIYGQRYRCCERIHAMISSESDESCKKSRDKHIKLSVDNLRCDKTNPVGFGSFGIRKGMTKEENSIALSSMYKLKRENRQRRFNLSFVK